MYRPTIIDMHLYDLQSNHAQYFFPRFKINQNVALITCNIQFELTKRKEKETQI